MANKTVWEQARHVHRVIRTLQSRLLIKHAAATRGRFPELTMPQLSALMVIRDHECMSLKGLAEALNVSAPSASAMADRLVELGVLHREQSAHDRREIRLSLSKLGLQALSALENQLLANLVDLLEGLGPERAEQWCAIYREIEALMDRPEAAATAMEGSR
jgi:DNA-binding MarR family transcriptional regulator